MPIINRNNLQYVLGFNQDDVNYIVGSVLLANKYCHILKVKIYKTNVGLAVRDITRVFFNAPYLGKEPTTSWRYEIGKLLWGCSQWQ